MKYLAAAILALALAVVIVGWRATTSHSKHKSCAANGRICLGPAK